MTAGTSPAWRSLRAWPLPSVSRALALSETDAIPNFPYQNVLVIAVKPVGSARTLRSLLRPYHPLPVSRLAFGALHILNDARKDSLLCFAQDDTSTRTSC